MSAIVGVALFAAAAPAAVEPYGTNDAGGFRNVLPPGQNGTGNVTQLFSFRATGVYPPHWVDQKPLYENLLYAAPTLSDAQIGEFFKDATFGVPPGDIASTTTPRPGVTIVRDASYGVPHIYGDTRGDVIFGAGYANAADRLFLMDILRHTGRAQLSSFIGGGAGNRAQDRTQWQFAPYTEADLQAQIDAAPALYGAEGAQAVQDVNEYVAGVNQYISEAQADPAMMPGEYTASATTPETWKATDVVATASLIGAIFGRGGGREVDSALAMQALVKRFGKRAGRAAWRGFREKDDPNAPTTTGRSFPYQTAGAFSKRGLAVPKPGSVKDAPVAPPLPEQRVGRGNSIGEALSRQMQEPHASNWLLVSGRESATGRPIAVMGPQTGYFTPANLMEMDLHGPGIDARGAAFPGVGLFVLLGHGRDYAWSATTANADNIDTFAEVLCRDNFHYRYKGRCLAMEKLERTNSWEPGLFDETKAGSETLTAYRTVHGIVTHRGRVRGKKVAFVAARSTYFHEADSVLGFSLLNDPGFMNGGPAAFKQAVSKISFLFNWAYIDSGNIAYYTSGALPRRAKGTSPDFPILGTGKFDWRGYDPATHTLKTIGFKAHPQAVNPRFLVSWNNKQAPDFAAADDQYSYGPLQRSQLLSDKVRRGTKGAATITLAELVQAMELGATQDLRAYKVLPKILRAIGKPGGRLGKALRKLRAWRKAGSHRRDLDRDGVYENNDAIVLMDAWWPGLVTTVFRPELGRNAFAALEEMLALGDHTRTNPRPPSFFGGWWGYLSRDLGRVVKRKHGNRVYCGGGSLRECRSDLRASLRRALKVKPGSLYGFGGCAANPQPSCFDQNRPVNSTGFPVGPFPFQNRPTFQQTVAVPQNLPRR